MRFLIANFSRLVVFILLVAFTVLSCSNPIGGPTSMVPSPSQDDSLVITPGEGTPRYVDLTAGGQTANTGITALFIENNRNAEGVVVLSTDTGAEDHVLVYNPYNDSTVSVFFNKGGNFLFPTSMIIT